MLRRRPKIQRSPSSGPFRIVITAVHLDKTTAADTEDPAWYRGEFARDEEQRPEVVLLTIPLLPNVDQARAVKRAANVAERLDTMYRGQRFLEHHRVKVLPAATRDGAR